MKFVVKFKEKPYPYLLVFVLVLAAVLRFWQLDFQSLWLDEIYTMNMANPANSWSEIYRLSFINDPLSVLYFILLNSFFKIFGYTAVVARLFSALMGLIGIFLSYKLGKEIKNQRTGLVAAAFLTLNYFHIFYSQEARVYSMYMAASVLSFLYLLKFLKRPTVGSAVKYGFTVLLLLLSHFFGFFALAAQLLCILCLSLLLKKTTFANYFGLTSLSMLVAFIGYLPVIPIFLMLTKNKGTWIDAPDKFALFKLFREFNGNSTVLSCCFAALIASAFISVLLQSLSQSKGKIVDPQGGNQKLMLLFFLSLWILVSFLIPFLLSIFKFPIFHSRYMISYLPAFLLLAALGVDAVSSKLFQSVIIVLVLSFSARHLFLLRNYYETESKANFRGASNFVLTHSNKKTPLVTTLPYHFEYYFRKHLYKFDFNYKAPKTFIAEMNRGTESKRAFWWIDAHGRTFEIDSFDRKFFDDNFKVDSEFLGFDAWAKYYVPKDSLNH